MNKLIKNLSNKLVKLESEAKNFPPHPNQMIPNWGFNPQYHIPPRRLLQQAEEVTDNQEDQFLTYSDDEDGEHILKGEEEEEEVPPEDQEIDNYCRKFMDFMQAQLQKNYDLRSSRKRTQGQEKIKSQYQDNKPLLVSLVKGRSC